MSEIELHQPQTALTEKMEWSRAVAPSNLLPKQYRDSPANLLFAVEYADALKVERIHAITSIHVIEGKPSASADLIAATVRRAGHKLRIVGDDTYAEAHLIRADDSEFTYTARWDVAKARQAGLMGKGVWKNYPGAMLRSRAITEVARMGASDALFGVQYTPEELGADSLDGSDLDRPTRPTQQAPAPAADRMRAALHVEQVPTTSATEAPTHDPAPERGVSEGGSDESGNHQASVAVESITSAQTKKIAAAMGDLGITARPDALLFVNDVIRRDVDVTSRNELSKVEASQVIEALEDEIAKSAAAQS